MQIYIFGAHGQRYLSERLKQTFFLFVCRSARLLQSEQFIMYVKSSCIVRFKYHTAE